MTTKPDPDFDPRFDPAFQRGFADGAEQPTRQGSARSAVGRTPPQSRYAEPVADGPVTGTRAPAGTRTVTPPAPGAPITTPVSGPTDDAAEADRERRPNPFLIALGALSVVLVAAGMWGVQTARAPFLGTNVATDVDFVGLQILQVLAPMSIALGAATAIGVLFVFAVDWQKRRA